MAFPLPKIVCAWATGLSLVLAAAAGARAGDFVNFESAHVHPLGLSPAGDELYAINTPEARLSIFEVQPDGSLVFAADVPVGLEPVSLAVRPGGAEVWVANHISDSVSIVDVATRALIATLWVGDEPTDVAFASGRAFVSLAGMEDRVVVFDAATRAEITSIDLFGDDPRAMAVRGNDVGVVVLESGNGTTALHQNLVALGGGPPAATPPRDPGLPGAAPEDGLIVQLDPATGLWKDDTGTDWSAFVAFNLPDEDLFVIDAAAATPSVVTAISGVGTNLFDIAVHPVSGDAWIPNTDARNLVRFEPNLRGHLVETRVSIVDATTGTVAPVDLNPHIDYGTSPGPAGEIALSLAQPGNGVFRSDGSVFYLTAFGSAVVAVLDGTTGAVTARIDVGGGPSGVALLESADRLYVMNRFDHTVSVVDTLAASEIAVHGVSGPAGFDPSPPEIRNGRRFLYDARISSGHGDIACGTCHVFSNFDGLAWDLGDPTGGFLDYDDAPWVSFDPVGTGKQGFDPMKGPMTTQTLRSLEGMQPLHWRGDKPDFQAFNGAFVSLMGRSGPFSVEDMQAFSDFIMTVKLPPNPHRELDDTLPASIDLPHDIFGPGDPSSGETIFTSVVTSAGGFVCNDCHLLPTGTMNTLTGGAGPQDVKIPHLRNVYEKIGFLPFRSGLLVNLGPDDQKSGFGVLHGGKLSLLEFLGAAFGFAPADLLDVTSFLLTIPTGTLPCVGWQQTVDASTSGDAGVLALLLALIDEAEATRCDLVVKGSLATVPVGFVYDVANDEFTPDSSLAPAVNHAALLASLVAGDALTYTTVPTGSGQRLGVDRDRDQCRDRDEALPDDGSCLGQPNPACSDGLDNDGDGLFDHFEDPGCRHAAWHTESPQCNDGLDNDDDGLVDLDDPQCGNAWQLQEHRRDACGLGFELALLLPPLLWARRRRLG